MFMNQKTSIIKMAMIAKLIYRFNTIPVRIPASFFVEIQKLILKFERARNCKEPKIARTILKKNKVGGFSF